MERWLFHFLVGLDLVLGEPALREGVTLDYDELSVVSEAALYGFVVVLFDGLDHFIFTLYHDIFIDSTSENISQWAITTNGVE